MSEDLDRVKAALAAAEEVVAAEEAQQEARAPEGESGEEGVAQEQPAAREAPSGARRAAQAERRGPPSLGEVVLFRLSDGPRAGEIRPALVVRVPQEQGGSGRVNLAVFTDFASDGLNCPCQAVGVEQGGGPGEYRRV